MQAYSVPDDLAEHIDLISPMLYFDSTKAHATIQERIPMEGLEEQKKRESLEQQTKRDYIQSSCLTTYVSQRTNQTYEAITPTCIKQLYNTVGYQPDTNPDYIPLSFANFLGQSPSFSDLKLYEQEFNLPSRSFDILALINGGINDQNPLTESDGEANLDVQLMTAVVAGLPISTYITGGK